MTPETATLERPAQDAEVLLRVENLRMHFPVYKGILRRRVGVIKAVDGISFDIRRGETLGLVGEYGFGKTTAGRTILRLYNATGGRILFGGQPPHLTAAPTSCPFAARCANVHDRCRAENPPLVAVAEGHEVACWWRPPDIAPDIATDGEAARHDG